ncbi:ribosomal-protein-alanine N-acetyltransferase [compost metagenome]
MYIAKNLVKMALVSAKKRGFKTCALEVKNDNQSAIKLYESLGFSDFEQKETSKIMKAPLA